MPKRPGRGAEQFVIRLPDGMRDQIKESAERNNRSMNAEMVARLEQSFVSEMTQSLDEGPIFNMVLDAKGRPLGWPEIAAHIHRTAKAAGVESVGFKAAIFNTAPADDDPFAKEYMRLIRWYQEQTRLHKHQIEGDDGGNVS